MSPTDRLRICYVVAHFYPRESGAERQALAQGIELARRGHEVHVVTSVVPGQKRNDYVHGITIHRWVKLSTRGPLFGLGFVSGVTRALARLRPLYDIVHTHQALWEAVATGSARPVLGRVPTIVQPASSGYYGEAEQMARTKGFPLLRRLALNNTAFVAISEEIERQWLGLGVDPTRLIRLASGVDVGTYRPGKSLVESSLPPRPRVVFTGRLHPQKDLDVLLDAWPDVARRAGASLVLVGDGPDRARLAEKASRLGVADRVRFVGRVADPAEYLRAADVFVLPSNAEGMSNSLLEAMATGLPCVASAIGGNTDLLGPESAGLLVAPGDSAGWASALVRVLSEPDLAAALGASAKGRVDREYAIPAVIDRYVALYRRLLARGPVNPPA